MSKFSSKTKSPVSGTKGGNEALISYTMYNNVNFFIVNFLCQQSFLTFTNLPILFKIVKKDNERFRFILKKITYFWLLMSILIFKNV